MPKAFVQLLPRDKNAVVAAALSALAVLVSIVASPGMAGASSSALGTPNAATGAPVTVGLISDGATGSGGTFALVEQGEKMAVSWANQYRKGLGGHPIKLLVCESQGTPSGALECANQMVQAGVVAVVLPFSGEGPTEVPVLAKAGIPYIAVSGESTQELTTPGAFALSGGYPAVLAAYAANAKAKGYKKFAMITENVPTAIQGATILGGQVFKKAGVGFKIIPVDPGTADITPQLESAVQYGANAIGVTGDITLCTSFFQAYQTLGLKIPKYIIATCIDPSVTKSSLSSELAGSVIATSSANGTKDAATYAAMVKKYAPKVNSNPSVSGNVASGATAIWAVVNALSTYRGPVTAATVTAQMKAAKNVTLPLSGGVTFTCNGQALPLLPSVCSVATQVGTVKANGQAVNLKLVNPVALFKS